MDKVKETLNKVPLSGYIVLVIAIAIFSGLFANAGSQTESKQEAVACTAAALT